MSAIRTLLALGASLSVITLAIPAHAADPIREVRYGDLDLSTEKGVATLNRRIKVAADVICGPRLVGPRMETLWKQCREATVASTSKSVELAIATAQRDSQLTSAPAAVTAAR